MEAGWQGFKGRNVLVAEPERLLRRQLASAMKELGLQTWEVSRGEEALEVVSTVEVHALVVDQGLPEYGGLETIRVIQTFQEVPPFLLLAHEMTRELRAAAFESEATSILPKPVNVDLMLDILASMLLRLSM